MLYLLPEEVTMSVQAYRCRECHLKFMADSSEDCGREVGDEAGGKVGVHCPRCKTAEVEAVGLGPREVAVLLGAVTMFRTPMWPVEGG